MKRLFFFFGVLISGLSCSAVNTVQMTPLKTTAGITSNKSNVINIELANSDDIYAIQFFLYLPEGMSLPQKGSGSLYTTLDEEVEEDLEFICSSSYNSTGNYYTVMIYTTTSNVIPQGGCSVLSIRYTTDSNMADGVYPVIMRSTKIETGSHVQTTTPETSSYVVIGDAMPEHIDLSGMTGYIPPFVVEQLNSDMSATTKSLNLSGTTAENLGADIVVPEGSEMLWYTSDKATLNRTFAANTWSTICLPFTLETSALSGTPTVKELDSYDAGESSVTLGDVTTLERGKPYMVKCGADTKLINDVPVSNCEPVTNSAGSITSGNLTMYGSYLGTTVSSDGSTTYYGFSNNNFVKVNEGGTGRVKPFRAYLALTGVAGSRSIGISGEGNTTGIEKVVDDGRHDDALYTLQGVKLDNATSKGVYIHNGKKLIVK